MKKTDTVIMLLCLILVTSNACTGASTVNRLSWKKIGEGEGFNFDLKGEWKGGPLSDFVYVGHEPRLIVITDEVAVPSLQGRMLPAHLKRVAGTNFSSYWVAVVYQGKNNRPYKPIQIDGVRLEDKVVIIDAQFQEPDRSQWVAWPLNSPYYVLKITKPAGIKEDEIAFVLHAGDQVIPQMCAIQGESLAWEGVITDPDTDSRYQQSSPKLTFIANQDGLSAVQDELPPIHLKLISAVDLSAYFLIVAYQGEKSTTGYSIEVIDIRRQDDTILVCAQFHEPCCGGGGAMTSPYYVAQVEKSDALKGEFTFVLMNNTEEAARQTATVQ